MRCMMRMRSVRCKEYARDHWKNTENIFEWILRTTFNSENTKSYSHQMWNKKNYKRRKILLTKQESDKRNKKGKKIRENKAKIKLNNNIEFKVSINVSSG